jgi:hypothetical protein
MKAESSFDTPLLGSPGKNNEAMGRDSDPRRGRQPVHASAARVYAAAAHPWIDPVIIDVAVARLSPVASFGWVTSGLPCGGPCASRPPPQGRDPSPQGFAVAD